MKITRRIAGTAAAFIIAVSNIPAAPVYAVYEDETPDFNVQVNAPPHILFIGDSIISGYGLEGYDPAEKSRCDSFANILSREFNDELPEQADFTYINEGLDGRTSAQLLDLLRSGEIDDELKNADAVVVSIGGNDLLDTLFSLFESGQGIKAAFGKILSFSSDLNEDLDGFEKNMPQIAAELDSRTDGKIFVQTLYDPLEDTSLSIVNELAEEKIGRLNDIIKSGSESGGYIVCDLAGDFSGRSHELTNIDSYDIHPNAEGHKLIAEKLDTVIRSQTYTYYDYEAASQWAIDEACRKAAAEQAERDAKQRKINITLASSGGLAMLSLFAAIVTRKKKA